MPWNVNLQPAAKRMGGEGKRLSPGKDIISGQQASGVDSPFVLQACKAFKKDAEKVLRFFKNN